MYVQIYNMILMVVKREGIEEEKKYIEQVNPKFDKYLKKFELKYVHNFHRSCYSVKQCNFNN